MSILRGRIYPNDFVPAEFSDKIIDIDFVVSPIAFAKCEKSGEIVFSPTNMTVLDVPMENTCGSYNSSECYKEFGVSIFAFIDLYVHKCEEEVRRLVDQAIMSREYTVEN